MVWRSGWLQPQPRLMTGPNTTTRRTHRALRRRRNASPSTTPLLRCCYDHLIPRAIPDDVTERDSGAPAGRNPHPQVEGEGLRHAEAVSLTSSRRGPTLKSSACNSTAVVRPVLLVRPAPRELLCTEQTDGGPRDRAEAPRGSQQCHPARPRRCRGHGTRRGAGSPLHRRRLPAAQRRRLPRAHGLQRRRDHLPPARLLGPHRPDRAHRARRLRLRLAAALLLPRHPDPQGHQAPARRRHLAAADPYRGLAPA
ncbi:hypothetical protein NOCARDAX2BIS_260005 [Nocardioides sp. AX2bis]|nr:hypothetical protein NOCARDAX2BIS_260005 [Nocardioides sp. AX2bis]